jgi:iron complex transport system permease protein
MSRLVGKKLFVILLLLLLGAVFLGIAVGPVHIPLTKSIAALWGGSDGGVHERILFDVRLPRVLLGLLVGWVLALSGGVMQGVFRNPLADPYLLGIASGASAGAAVTLALGWDIWPFALPAGAFLGAWLVVLIVYRVASSPSAFSAARFDNYALILTGVALAALFSAVTSFFIFTAQSEDLRKIVFWLMGGLGAPRWAYIGPLLAVAALGTVALLVFSRELNALALGEPMARHLGVNTETLKKGLLLVVTLMTASAVSVAGTIGFVGLIVPHAMRLIAGPDHRRLLLASAFAGAAFLVLCDMVARTVLAPAELPVGIITALWGAPFFLFLLRRSRRTMLPQGRFTS